MAQRRDDHPVLVPVDFSVHSEAALMTAVELAACLGHSLLVLHVVHDPGDMPGYYSRALRKKKQLRRIEDGAAEMLEDFLRRVVKDHPERGKLTKLDSLLVKGLPTTRILEVAEKRGASMIVIGSKGLAGIRHLVMGSVAERVVHFARIPVTVVKAPA